MANTHSSWHSHINVPQSQTSGRLGDQVPVCQCAGKVVRLRASVSGLQRSQQEFVRAQRLLLHLKMHKMQTCKYIYWAQNIFPFPQMNLCFTRGKNHLQNKIHVLAKCIFLCSKSPISPAQHISNMSWNGRAESRNAHQTWIFVLVITGALCACVIFHVHVWRGGRVWVLLTIFS